MLRFLIEDEDDKFGYSLNSESVFQPPPPSLHIITPFLCITILESVKSREGICIERKAQTLAMCNIVKCKSLIFVILICTFS